MQAKTLLKWLQGRHPGRFEDGQLRTLQRRVREWQALFDPAKETFFAQVHHPGRLGASDFTHMTELGVTLGGQPFAHLLYHFVLTYSNWETASICFSESFESLSEGLQRAFWELGGVPERHRTDRMADDIDQETFARKSTEIRDRLASIKLQLLRGSTARTMKRRSWRRKCLNFHKRYASSGLPPITTRNVEYSKSCV